MDYKEIVKAGHNQIAERTTASEDVRLLNDFIELLSSHAKVLDAGCGAGLPISSSLADLFDVIGIDFSEAQSALANQNVPNAEFICEDMTKLKFPENPFDGICSDSVPAWTGGTTSLKHRSRCSRNAASRLCGQDR